jgi:carboxyl-terminal processing protease
MAKNNKIKLFSIILVASFCGFFSALAISQISNQDSLEKDNELLSGQEKSIIANNKTKDNQFKNPDNTEYKADANNKMVKEVFDIIKKEYVEGKSDRQVNEIAVSGLLSSLDPHSSYLNYDALKEMQVQTKGEFGGLGIEMSQEGGVIKVISAIEDTPAFKEGIKSGDYIVRIDGKSIVGLSIDEVVKKLRGKAGTSVSLSIARKGEKSLISKKITRQIIKVKAVKSAKFDNIGYIKIITFSEQAHIGMIEEIKKLKNKIGDGKMQGLILDLRNNPGGLLDQAVQITEEFLDKDKIIVSIKGRSSGNDKIYIDSSNENLIPNLPIVVIINEGSASASEIVAGALQDHKRGVVIGSKSFGKGSVQTVIPLNNQEDGALRLTTALYYTPNNRSIQAEGIVPDIEIADAKIEKNKNDDKSSEADLKGHIENQNLKELLAQEVRDAKGKKSEEEDLSLYNSDYQLARSLDLVKAIYVYKDIINKNKQEKVNNQKINNNDNKLINKTDANPANKHKNNSNKNNDRKKSNN